MSETTIYGVATKAWQPVVGCNPGLRCSPRCWARRTVARIVECQQSNIVRAEFFRQALTPDSKRWSGQVALDEAHLTDPLRWRKPQRIAVAYHGDLFRLPAEQIDRVFAVMALCPQHQFLVLTKAAREMREYFVGREHEIRGAVDLMVDEPFACERFAWPLPNVWLGVSCLDQPDADERGEHG
jgi:protein gp37